MFFLIWCTFDDCGIICLSQSAVSFMFRYSGVEKSFRSIIVYSPREHGSRFTPDAFSIGVVQETTNLVSNLRHSGNVFVMGWSEICLDIVYSFRVSWLLWPFFRRTWCKWSDKEKIGWYFTVGLYKNGSKQNTRMDDVTYVIAGVSFSDEHPHLVVSQIKDQFYGPDL